MPILTQLVCHFYYPSRTKEEEFIKRSTKLNYVLFHKYIIANIFRNAHLRQLQVTRGLEISQNVVLLCSLPKKQESMLCTFFGSSKKHSRGLLRDFQRVWSSGVLPNMTWRATCEMYVIGSPSWS